MPPASPDRAGAPAARAVIVPTVTALRTFPPPVRASPESVVVRALRTGGVVARSPGRSSGRREGERGEPLACRRVGRAAFRQPGMAGGRESLPEPAAGRRARRHQGGPGHGQDRHPFLPGGEPGEEPAGLAGQDRPWLAFQHQGGIGRGDRPVQRHQAADVRLRQGSESPVQRGLGPGIEEEPGVLGLRQAQRLAQPLGIGGRAYRQGGEAAHRVGRRLRRGKPREAAEIADPAGQALQQARLRQDGDDGGRAAGDEELQQFPRTRSRERSASPSRAAIAADSPSASGAPAP
ncbi:hypothetical protein Maq22A_1p38055 (plasmid) [Methylobacterium aquaticum]|uniref:Uncharacterized protein n=1 Tax=Methylobacterium aquaticum TaxID=270351 RepID=A0A0C6FW30_9HYPH|nr:hypothetical protein Maq22A_1p38055 [Methylobacterium aquaticum]